MTVSGKLARLARLRGTKAWWTELRGLGLEDELCYLVLAGGTLFFAYEYADGFSHNIEGHPLKPIRRS